MTIFFFQETIIYCWCVIIDYIFSDACAQQWPNFQLTVALPFLIFYLNLSVLNTLSEYTYFHISKNITSYTFLLVLKIVESLHCILKNKYNFTSYQKTLFHIDYQSISIDQNNLFSNILYRYHNIGVT